MMKLNTLLAVPALLGALLLSACGEKTTEATDAAKTTDAAAQAEVAPVAEVAPAPPAAADTAGGGGYEPTAEERILGETRPVSAPAEAAPVETAPAN